MDKQTHPQAEHAQPETDEMHFLNGREGKQREGKGHGLGIWGAVTDHLKKYSTPYFCVLTFLLVAVLAIQIEKDYQAGVQKDQMLRVWRKQAANAIPAKSLNEAEAIHQALQVSRKFIVETHQEQEKEKQATNIAPKELQPQKFAGTDHFPLKETNNEPKKPSAPTPSASKEIPVASKSIKTTQNQRPIAGVSMDQRKLASRLLKIHSEPLDVATALAKQQREYYEQKYHVSQYPQLPFCVVVPSYNNVKNDRHRKNLQSILQQEYQNYHLVFIDDASTDGTGAQVEAMLANQTLLPADRYVVIRNKEQKRAMPNLRRAAQEFCKGEEVFLIVDGDDELLGRQVLKLFSAVMQEKKVWFMYTNFLNIRGTVGYSRPFPVATMRANKYRSYPFVTSHLRAFYTQLFRNIQDKDLRDNEGNYLKAANDVAICIPILEQAHERVAYVPELNYYYNSNTGQNNHQIRLREQKSNDKMLRKRKPYEPLTQLMPNVTEEAVVQSNGEKEQPKEEKNNVQEPKLETGKETSKQSSKQVSKQSNPPSSKTETQASKQLAAPASPSQAASSLRLAD